MGNLSESFSGTDNVAFKDLQPIKKKEERTQILARNLFPEHGEENATGFSLGFFFSLYFSDSIIT